MNRSSVLMFTNWYHQTAWRITFYDNGWSGWDKYREKTTVSQFKEIRKHFSSNIEYLTEDEITSEILNANNWENRTDDPRWDI